MMRARLMLSLLAAALVAAPVPTAFAAEKFGAGVSLTQTTPLTELLQRPEAFEGKTVLVEGIVTAVCTEMGCWMALAPDAAPDRPTLMVNVEHGAVVLPVAAKVKRAAAQGELRRISGGEGQAAASEKARAEGKKVEDSARWHIQATGVVVY